MHRRNLDQAVQALGASSAPNLSRLTITVTRVLELAGKLTKSTERIFRDSKSQIFSFTVITDRCLQFSGDECFSARSLTVSVQKPPTSMLSTSSAILPAVAGEVFLPEVNAWVRLSISDACNPGSGFFAGVVYSFLLSLFVPSTSSTVDSTSRVFPPVRLLPSDMSSISVLVIRVEYKVFSQVLKTFRLKLKAFSELCE